MNPHGFLDDQIRDLIALHALGLLSGAEAEGFEAHLDACAACRAEAASSRRVVQDLALVASPAEPSATLRARVLAAARTATGGSAEAGADSRLAGAPPPAAQGASRSFDRPMPWKTWSPSPVSAGFAFALVQDAVWESTPAEGVEARRLYLDEANDRVTMLVRMAPGSSYPAHLHRAAEECYVIDGDLYDGKVRMRSGDYKRSLPGSTDEVQSTENGCLILIVSSLRDELLPDRSA